MTQKPIQLNDALMNAWDRLKQINQQNTPTKYALQVQDLNRISDRRNRQDDDHEMASATSESLLRHAGVLMAKGMDPVEALKKAQKETAADLLQVAAVNERCPGSHEDAQHRRRNLLTEVPRALVI